MVVGPSLYKYQAKGAEKLACVDMAMRNALRHFPANELIEAAGVISFAEKKAFDASDLARFLEGAQRFNRWSNRGPAWYALTQSYEDLFQGLIDKRVIPCANGGIALEALAGIHNVRAGRPLKWCVSAFGFANTNRGLFADSIKVDCDHRGVLSIESLARLDPNSFDGLVVTNPFGLLDDFQPFVDWRAATGKPLLIDNAAGIHTDIPDLPYQSFSLHHTKPYGFGEGGLAVVPAEDYEHFLRLIEYQPLSEHEARFWVNNGKLSEVACAALLMRLEDSPRWLPLYQEQNRRIRDIGKKLGYAPLLESDLVTMGFPLVAPHCVQSECLSNDLFVIGKYYRPIADLTVASDIFDRIVNVPSHPGMKRLSDNQIEDILLQILEKSGTASKNTEIFCS
ncbi:DegT/DnrJ/EryC1/StrS family aminotransferase [Roseibium polysiphoniae]|uniref:DegT/DnrJ/EryC1/StrS aminotransferase family protein n=1 Tax=Roseibium polysiphoniae TaxID=2571221 RepID=A0ABR9CAM2_9HYPH|nr:DegT/DnrJ/EryC1/StrS family aminotransferase [Roseibium polysiphoniae]MBD8876653.1 DegT/DnrJ/EryC1/StrS aminotransferase family protein [Roseibium polysiphoniae]